MSLHRDRHRSAVLAASAGGLLILVTACASPTESTPDPAAEGGGGGDVCAESAAVDLAERAGSLEGSEREDLLLEEAVAARDGAVDFYTEINDPQVIVDAFEEKYGDLTVNVYRAGSEQIRQRVLEESDARFSGADLIEMDTLEMAILDENALLAPAASPLVEELSEAARFDNYIGDRLSYIVPGWNTNAVSPEQVPQSLEDYATFDAGKLALEGSDVFWFAGMVMHMESEGKTREEAVQVFKDLAANADITSGHTTTTELVVAGQYAIAPNHYVHRLLELQGKGAPIAWDPVNIPVVAEITATSVHCLSDNPAAAMLLQDFILSADGGQQIFIDEGRTPANESMAQETLGGVDIDPLVVDVADVADNYAEWAELWDEVVRGGNAA
ncbi:ABC transporter substrate-binding protein [Actinotalea sp. Marseille-Q4924]|uniref:ABC transporter substrate-binding protein n=1 Tax=Actinotalea sp. Marseille-Q4924 TaxID=2866571 RepID=UPI001CE47180|nr:extracellular solute-binding protein [Actinotalea sp. Marseille-Q4924]